MGRPAHRCRPPRLAARLSTQNGQDRPDRARRRPVRAHLLGLDPSRRGNLPPLRGGGRARAAHFGHVRYVVPVRSLRIWEDDPRLPAVDQEVLEVVPTAPFAGIADYLVRSPYLTLRNWRADQPRSRRFGPRLAALAGLQRADRAARGKAPGSAALRLGGGQRRRRGARPDQAAGPGSRRARGRRRVRRGGPFGGAQRTGRRRSAVSCSTASSTPTTWSLSRRPGPPPDGPPWTIAWAGRMAGEKGLPVLFEALDLLLKDGVDAQLLMIGDGPERAVVETARRTLPAGRVRLAGYVGDFDEYLASAAQRPRARPPVRRRGRAQGRRRGDGGRRAGRGHAGRWRGRDPRTRRTRPSSCRLPMGQPWPMSIHTLLENADQRAALSERGLVLGGRPHRRACKQSAWSAGCAPHFPDLRW